MNAPDRPVMVFDGDCGFCRRWIERWRHTTGDRIDYVAFQDAGSRFADIPQEQFAQAVHLIEADGHVARGAEAVFRALAVGAGRRWPLWCYRHVPFAASFTEVLLSRGRAPPTRRRPTHHVALGPARSPAGRHAHGRVVPSPHGRHVRDRFSVAVGAGGRARRRARDSSGSGVSAGGQVAGRPDSILVSTDAVLVRRERRRVARDMHRRDVLLAACDRRSRSRGSVGGIVALLLVAHRRGSELSFVPVGQPPARSGVHRALDGAVAMASARIRPAAARRAVVGALALVSTDGLVRRRQAHERRSHVARAHRTRFPLLHATAPAVDGVVRATVARAISETFRAGDVRDRRRGTVFPVGSTARALRGRVGHRGSATLDLRDRELRLLQHSGTRLVRSVSRRRRVDTIPGRGASCGDECRTSRPLAASRHRDGTRSHQSRPLLARVSRAVELAGSGAVGLSDGVAVAPRQSIWTFRCDDNGPT